MKNILVLSEITYVPGNCNIFLEKLLKDNCKTFHAVVILKNLDFGIYLKIIWLYIIGCPLIASELVKNIILVLFKRREKILHKYKTNFVSADSMNNVNIVNWIKSNNIDFIFNVRTRCIYKNNILKAPKYGCYNIHHGLLPKYRGMYCDLYALYEQRQAGISLHKMNRKIDDGEIIYTKVVSRKNDKNYIEYLRKTGDCEAKLIRKFIKFFIINNRAPSGKLNSSINVVYTKTPNANLINQMKQSGIQL